MTGRGYEDWNSIINFIYIYIDLFKKDVNLEILYLARKTVSSINFYYNFDYDILKESKTLSHNRYYTNSSEYIFSRTLLHYEYNEAYTKEVLGYLTPENSNVFIGGDYTNMRIYPLMVYDESVY